MKNIGIYYNLESILGCSLRTLLFDNALIDFDKDVIEVRGVKVLAISTHQGNKDYKNILLASSSEGLDIQILDFNSASERKPTSSCTQTYYNGLSKVIYKSSFSFFELKAKVMSFSIVTDCDFNNSFSRVLGAKLDLSNNKSIFIEPYDSNHDFLFATIKTTTEVSIYLDNFLINHNLHKGCVKIWLQD